MWTVSLGTLGGVSQSLANQVLAMAQAAAAFWDRYVDSSLADIDVDISFAALEPGVLAQGGADLWFDHSANGFDYYAATAVIEMQGGGDQNGADPDIYIEINSDELNGGQFGFAPLIDGLSFGVAGKFDLWTVLVHEIGHGLGLLSLSDVDPVARTTFEEFVFGSYFDGLNPYFGPISLDLSVAHLADFYGALLSPVLSPGVALYLSRAELSIFGDFGVPLRVPTEGADRLYAMPIYDLFGGFGDNVRGLGGDDTIDGLVWTDELHGDDGDDRLDGRAGDDRLDGAAGSDVLAGGSGADFLDGGADADSLDGGAGDDSLVGGAGADAINGGAGRDVVDYRGTLAPITIILGGVSTGGDAQGDRLTGVEILFGALANDTLYGDGGANALDGSGGADFLFGGAGNDTLIADSFVDSLEGGAGADTFEGYAHVQYRSSPGAVRIDLTTGINAGDAAGDIFASAPYAIEGSAYNDTMIGHDGLDQLVGGKGDDSLNGAGGGNYFTGGKGRDTLNGTLGFDTAIYSGETKAVFLDLTGGATVTDDVLIAIERLTLTNFGDTLFGNGGSTLVDPGAGADRLDMKGGDDTIVGGAGADTVNGGTGIDLVTYFATIGAVSVNLATNANGGAAAGDVYSNIENIIGSDVGDTIVGSSGTNELDGGAGDDQLLGGDGSDVLKGGFGGDLLDGGAGNDAADFAGAGFSLVADLALQRAYEIGRPGIDTLIGIETLIGSVNSDRLFGDGADNLLVGGYGSDTLAGRGGADTMIGDEAGADSFYYIDLADYSAEAAGVSVDLALGLAGGAAAGDVLIGIDGVVGGDFSDTLTGDAETNALTGGAGDDVLMSGGATGDWDTLSGGAGNDHMVATGTGNCVFIGGAGADTMQGAATGGALVSYDGEGAVSVDLTTGVAGGAAAGDLLINISALYGSAFNDALIGGVSGTDINGRGGDDQIVAGAGGGFFGGGAGNDTITASGAADTMKGGSGTDVVNYANAASGVSIGLNGAVGAGGAVGDKALEFEGVIGSAFSDTISGGKFADFLSGGGGADFLMGLNGSDTLDGGAGNDRLTDSIGFNLLLGGSGHDTISGGGFADTLDGGFGLDSVTGGGGADLFIDTKDGVVDVIADFGGAEDVIRLIGFGAAFDTFAEVLSAASDNGVDTTIAFGGGDILILRNTLVTQLNADDFQFG